MKRQTQVAEEKTYNVKHYVYYKNNLCNENQSDALFILKLFRQTTSTCFGRIYCPSSGGIRGIYKVNTS
jgi:hypothetical protein